MTLETVGALLNLVFFITVRVIICFLLSPQFLKKFQLLIPFSCSSVFSQVIILILVRSIIIVIVVNFTKIRSLHYCLHIVSHWYHQLKFLIILSHSQILK